MNCNRLLAAVLALAMPCVSPAAETKAKAKADRALSAVGFIVAMARATGAEDACEQPIATSLRLCVEFLIPHWHDITGLPMPGSTEQASLPVIWKHAFESAREIQAGPTAPVSCQVVTARVVSLPVWSDCGGRPHHGGGVVSPYLKSSRASRDGTSSAVPDGSQAGLTGP